MKKQTIKSAVCVLFAGILFCGCGKSDSKWEQLKKQREKKRREAMQDQAVDPVSVSQSAKVVLKTADVKSVFKNLGWQSDAREAGKEIKGEVMYKVSSGSHSFRAAVQAQSDDTQKLERVTIYITGPHVKLETVEQFPPKLMETLNGMSSIFKDGFSKALNDMRALTDRGTPRRVGSGYLNSKGWKCVVVNYISEQKNRQPYMIIVEKI